MESMTEWLMSLQGGLLVGTSSVLMLIFKGRITGISGIVNGILNWDSKDSIWRVAFVAGLIFGGFCLKQIAPQSFGSTFNANPILLIMAGLLVGFGTVLGSGCTSGHGVCGVSRLSKRSITATALFMGFGIFVVTLIRHLIGGF